VVDLLGWAGRLHDAEVLIKTMPCEPNATVWMALLGACRIHGNLEMENALQEEYLNRTQEILQAVCCYRISMLLLATGISVQLFKN
jgi:hypothetical protein